MIAYYRSKIGNICFTYNDYALLTLGFIDEIKQSDKENTIAKMTKEWLDAYFNEGIVKELPPLELDVTPFQKRVYEALMKVDKGKVISYKTLGGMIASKGYRAIGQALNKNPIAIMIPCHRIVNENGGLGGYAYGAKIKKALLDIESYEMQVV